MVMFDLLISVLFSALKIPQRSVVEDLLSGSTTLVPRTSVSLTMGQKKDLGTKLSMISTCNIKLALYSRNILTFLC